MVLQEGCRERVYYLFDTEDMVNINKRLVLNEVQSEARKLNKKEGRKRYKAKGGWVIHR